VTLAFYRARALTGTGGQLAWAGARAFRDSSAQLAWAAARAWSVGVTAITLGDDDLIDPGELAEMVAFTISPSMPQPVSWQWTQTAGPQVETSGTGSHRWVVGPTSYLDGVTLRWSVTGTLADGTVTPAVEHVVTVRANPSRWRQDSSGQWIGSVRECAALP
jgi:hypothetical protein